MKKYLLLSLLASLLSFSQRISAQIPNAGFENWTEIQDSSSGTKHIYYYPTAWDNTNFTIDEIGANQSVYRIDSSHSGSYALAITNPTSSGYTFVGLASNGHVNTGSISANGGTQINTRPVALNGFYKYFPVGVDSCSISITLTKNKAGVRETVGKGVFITGKTVSDWTSFSAVVNYTSSDVPDTVLINLSPFNFFYKGTYSIHAKTILNIDDLSFGLPNAVMNIQNNTSDLHIYPIPASKTATIQYSRVSKECVLQVINDLGQIELSYIVPANSTELRIDLSKLSSGLYTCKLLAGDSYSTRKLIKL